MKLNPKLRDFWATQKQIKVLYGGRMSSKTMDTAGFLIYIASKYKVRVACLRQFQNRIDQSVYSTLKEIIAGDDSFKDKFIVNKNSIIAKNTGSEFTFLGMQRNIEEIKGLHDVDITWIEESDQVTKEQWDYIRPTVLRKDFSFVIFVFNPFLVTDYVYQEFVVKQKPNVISSKINYTDNPFLSNSAKELISVDFETMEREDFDHIYLGEPKQDDNDAIIKRKWLNACIDAHKKLNIDASGNKQIGYDVADDGGDLNAYVVADGGILSEVESWKGAEDELFESSLKVFKKAVELKAWIIYDSNGVGAGCGSNFKQMNKKTDTYVWYEGFDSASSPHEPNRLYKISGADTQMKNSDYFENRKAQAWWEFADRCKATYRAVVFGDKIDSDVIISISSEVNELQKLITELSTPRKKTSGRLKNMVEKKEDLKKRGIASPNLADSAILAFTRLYKKRGSIGGVSKPRGI
jgi:phage terminase large subunit